MSHPTPKGYRTWCYHASCPEGKIFWSDETPDGWVDSPAKIKTTKEKVAKKKVAKKKVAKKRAAKK